nr:unnamed protein product [Spirometra erinaceieuropaei]
MAKGVDHMFASVVAAVATTEGFGRSPRTPAGLARALWQVRAGLMKTFGCPGNATTEDRERGWRMATLDFVMRHLLEAVTLQPTNRMSPRALALCLAPSLFGSTDDAETNSLPSKSLDPVTDEIVCSSKASASRTRRWQNQHSEIVVIELVWTIYEQIKGTPMGSPISGLIAEVVLQKLERRLFEEYEPKFWARYVDDTFVIIDQDKINYYEEVLNSIIPDLKFTKEEEVGDKLPFLDVLVCRQPNGELATSVYRKPANTLQMPSYNSNHPPQHKRSCVRTQYRRVETHCSTPAAKLEEIKRLRELFSANGHPRAFTERSRRQPKKRNEEHSQSNSWRSIPYVKGISEAVAGSLAPFGIDVAHGPDLTIRRQLMLPKAPIPEQEMSAVVYRLQCSCESCNYVGETGRRLQTRMHEHKLAVRRLDPKPEVANHAAQMEHIFNFDVAEIVGLGGDHTARQVQEAWMSTDHSVNRHIYLPLPNLTLRTFLAWDSHGAGQSGPSVFSAADGGDSGHGDMRVGCSHTGGIGGSRFGHRAPL